MCMFEEIIINVRNKDDTFIKMTLSILNTGMRTEYLILSFRFRD